MAGRRIAAFLAALVTWLLCASSAVATGLPVPMPSSSYAFDASVSGMPPDNTAPDRGRPAHRVVQGESLSHDAVGRGSHETSLRLGGGVVNVNTTYDLETSLAYIDSITGTTGSHVQATTGELSALRQGGVAAKGGSQIAANAAADNAARDALAAAHPGSLIEQSFSTTAGVRRLDVLTQGGLGIESKVGRTSLTAATRSQIAKDSLLLRNGDVSGMEWVFSRSGVTGQVGPTGPLADALSKAGIPWSLAP